MNNDNESNSYVARVLTLYLEMPETPMRASVSDHRLARSWLLGDVPFEVVEIALLMGSLRRLQRPAEAPPLAPIRSLAYFSPILEELKHNPTQDGYRDFLRIKLLQLANSPGTPTIAN
jgi:hypothetical protein